MARMYPPELRPDTKSSAERRMFTILEGQLGDDWFVLHSLGIAQHKTKPWAEIDFVLIGPAGVFCLEVKGGRIARLNGKWGFINREDSTTWKDEGPFEQVGTAAIALHKHLKEVVPWIRDSVVAHGIVFPDIEFDEYGPDIISEIVYDVRDKQKPIGSYIRRLTNYWYTRLEPMRSKPIETLSDTKRSTLLEELRGDFDLRPSLRTQISSAVDELLHLTKEQYRILDGLVDNHRVIVRGGAGTGKTLLAVEEARRHAKIGNKILLCCYNRRLSDYVRKIVIDLPNIEVTNLHSLMASIVKDAGLSARLPDAQREDLFEVFYPELCLEALLILDKIHEYDVIIVDEAQDLLLDTYVDVFDALLKGGISQGIWRFFLDPYQDIFESISRKGLQKILQTGLAQYRLSVNCRNTKPVATATLLLSDVDCTDTLHVHGPEVEHQWYRDERHQQRMIINTLRRLMSEGISASDIIILSRYGLKRTCVRDRLSEFPYEILDMDDVSSVKPDKIIRFSTISSYKGLESDAILVIDINNLEDQEVLSSIYVGASRARAYLAVFISESQRSIYDTKAFEYGKNLLNNLNR